MKFSSFAARFLTLVVALLTLLPATAQRRRALDQPDPDLMRKLTIAQLAITQLYVDSVDQKKLVENAINGMLSKLDPHSAYSNPEETRRMNEPLEGNFEGIGVQFNMLEDTLVVIQTIAKGPSQKAGIVNGDRIVSVDGRPIAGVKLERDSIMKLLRGPKGTKVKLGIVRPSVGETLTFVVTRDKIPMNTLDAAYMIAPGVGYIRLDRFGATSGKEVRDAIQQLKKQGMKDLLLDLESNGGGYLGAAVEVASQFLNPKDLVVYTEGRATPKQVFDALSGGLFRKGRLVVLVDEFSASAAAATSRISASTSTYFFLPTVRPATMPVSAAERDPKSAETEPPPGAGASDAVRSTNAATLISFSFSLMPLPPHPQGASSP